MEVQDIILDEEIDIKISKKSKMMHSLEKKSSGKQLLVQIGDIYLEITYNSVRTYFASTVIVYKDNIKCNSN